jgi:hypothetical protein
VASVGCFTIVEREVKAALGQIDDKGIVFALVSVVIGELLPQTADLDADGGVLARVVDGRFAERVYADGVFLQLVGIACDGMVSQVLQQTPGGRRVAKGGALENAIDRLRFRAGLP